MHIVAANTDSKNDTIGLFTSPTFASATANIRTNTMIGTMSPDANECIGLFGINPKNMLRILPCCCAIAVATDV